MCGTSSSHSPSTPAASMRLGGLFERLGARRAPGHRLERRLVAGHDHDGVGVVVAPAAQVHGAVDAIDLGEADLVLVELDGCLDVRRRDRHVRQVGQQFDHLRSFRRVGCCPRDHSRRAEALSGNRYRLDPRIDSWILLIRQQSGPRRAREVRRPALPTRSEPAGRPGRAPHRAQRDARGGASAPQPARTERVPRAPANPLQRPDPRASRQHLRADPLGPASRRAHADRAGSRAPGVREPGDVGPPESTREFSIYRSDYGFATVGAVVSRLAAERAPDVRFRFMLHNPAIVDDAADAPAHRRRHRDPARLPHGPALHRSLARRVGRRRVRLQRRRRRRASLDGAAGASCPGRFTYQSRTAFTSASPAGAAARHRAAHRGRGRELPLACRTSSSARSPSPSCRPPSPHWPCAPAACACVGLPFDPTPLTNALWWHPVHGRDPEHAWMRDLFVEAGRIVDAGAHVPDGPLT